MERLSDNFYEEIIVRSNKTLSNILYALASLAMVVFAIIGVIGLQGAMGSFSIPMIIMFIVGGGLAFLMFRLKNSFRIDYEYTFTNGIVDIACVKNNTVRKELISFNTKNLEIMAPILTNGFERYQSMTNVKKIKAWLNRDREKHFAVVKKESRTIMLIFEPSEKLVELFKKYSPHTVKTK